MNSIHPSFPISQRLNRMDFVCGSRRAMPFHNNRPPLKLCNSSSFNRQKVTTKMVTISLDPAMQQVLIKRNGCMQGTVTVSTILTPFPLSRCVSSTLLRIRPDLPRINTIRTALENKLEIGIRLHHRNQSNRRHNTVQVISSRIIYRSTTTSGLISLIIESLLISSHPPSATSIFFRPWTVSMPERWMMTRTSLLLCPSLVNSGMGTSHSPMRIPSFLVHATIPTNRQRVDWNPPNPFSVGDDPNYPRPTIPSMMKSSSHSRATASADVWNNEHDRIFFSSAHLVDRFVFILK